MNPQDNPRAASQPPTSRYALIIGVLVVGLCLWAIVYGRAHQNPAATPVSHGVVTPAP